MQRAGSRAVPGNMVDPLVSPFEPEALPTVAVSATEVGSWEGDLLVLAVTEEDFATADEVTSLASDRIKALDAAMGGALAEVVAAGGFEGKPGSQSKAVRVGSAPGAKAKNVAMVGLGKAAKVSTTSEWGASIFQSLGTAVAAMAKANKSVKAAVALLEVPADAATAAGQIATGAMLGGHESLAFKSKKSPTASRLASVEVLGAGAAEKAAQALARALAVAHGTMLTRYLVEAPPNVCTPTHLADAALFIADRFPGMCKAEILEKEECEKMGMGCYLGVAEASSEPPRFIHLTYTPKGGASKKVALIGKGLTFDSGGYNIKAGPGSMIEMMKFDMGGAGAVLGAARIVAEMQPEGVEVHFIVAACENMVTGHGLRPGDILKAANGKTVEVNNTDAEGRLTLADALWFAQEKCGVTAVVDTATLTGACIVALGTEIGGLFTHNDAAASAMQAAAKLAGEKIWRMPMNDPYFDQLKSSVADMKNTGSRWAGAITAALFLKQFIKEDVEWAHFDIAGPVWDEKAGLATGYGAATLANWAVAHGKSA